eukprot:1941461-Rhodomonas_salina.1
MPRQRSTAGAEMWTQDEGSLHVRLTGFWHNLFKTRFYGHAIYNLYVLGSVHISATGPHFGDSLPTRVPGYPGLQYIA